MESTQFGRNGRGGYERFDFVDMVVSNRAWSGLRQRASGRALCQWGQERGELIRSGVRFTTLSKRLRMLLCRRV